MVMATPIGYDKVRKVYMKISKLKRALYSSKLSSLIQLLDPAQLLSGLSLKTRNLPVALWLSTGSLVTCTVLYVFFLLMPQSVIIATFCRHNVITCPESPDYHFLYVSQHFNSLFVHVHPGLHLETGQSSTTAAVHLVFRPTIGFLDLHNFTCASL
jgi:hypothetical protein